MLGLVAIVLVAALVGASSAAAATNPGFRQSWLKDPDLRSPDLIVNAFSSALHCLSGGAHAGDGSIAFCYEGGIHTRTVELQGDALFIHTPSGVTSCRLEQGSEVTEVIQGKPWTRTTGQCWEMVCRPGACGQAPVDVDRPWAITLLQRTGAAPFRPSGPPDLYFTGFAAFPVQLHSCHRTGEGKAGRTVWACYDGADNRTHDLIANGADLEVFDRGLEKVTIACRESPTPTETQIDGAGVSWRKHTADCRWSGTQQRFPGIVGHRG